ncbi:hypothetical protein [Oerskovia flava]|uniref:hypothetical protein n=1 Tax=Oerskovia flava TaxID=2986422 RepID=UPI002240592A|nr:hypothetical protein [Oerskovia sp. JB1-3-2]
MIGTSAATLIAGLAIAAAGWLFYRGTWRSYTPQRPYIPLALLPIGLGVAVLSGSGLVTGVVTRAAGSEPDGSVARAAAIAVVTVVCVLLAAAFVVIMPGLLPEWFRPRWETDAQGGTTPLTADGSSAVLPPWSSAQARTSLATSRGPVLLPSAVRWLERSWYGHGWRRFSASVEAQPLHELGMVDGAGRAVPEVRLGAQPLWRRDGRISVGGHGESSELPELTANIGRQHAVVLWTDGGAERGKRLDFVEPADVGKWILDFLERAQRPGRSWSVRTSHWSLELQGTCERGAYWCVGGTYPGSGELVAAGELRLQIEREAARLRSS